MRANTAGAGSSRGNALICSSPAVIAASSAREFVGVEERSEVPPSETGVRRSSEVLSLVSEEHRLCRDGVERLTFVVLVGERSSIGDLANRRLRFPVRSSLPVITMAIVEGPMLVVAIGNHCYQRPAATSGMHVTEHRKRHSIRSFRTDVVDAVGEQSLGTGDTVAKMKA